MGNDALKMCVLYTPELLLLGEAVISSSNFRSFSDFCFSTDGLGALTGGGAEAASFTLGEGSG